MPGGRWYTFVPPDITRLPSFILDEARIIVTEYDTQWQSFGSVLYVIVSPGSRFVFICIRIRILPSIRIEKLFSKFL
jgi:hypothetical protein